MNNVIVRSISGTVYIALIVGAIVGAIHGQQAWFLVLTSAFIILGVCEMEKLTIFEPAPGEDTPPVTVAQVSAIGIDALAALVIGVAPFLAIYCGFDYSAYAVLAGLPILFVARIIAAIYDDGPHTLFSIARSTLTVLYLGLPMLMLNLLCSESPVFVLLTFIFIWINDTGAFCFGSKLGKRKLFPRLSPKKSWEGFFGGLGCCLAFGAACWLWINCTRWGLAQWLAYAASVCVFATWGDLFESLIKRSCHTKDSGNLIPGHGGILDRIDSLLLVAPVAALFHWLV